jgi:hypothetical protein
MRKFAMSWGIIGYPLRGFDQIYEVRFINLREISLDETNSKGNVVYSREITIQIGD